jgi:hypothetical protein
VEEVFDVQPNAIARSGVSEFGEIFEGYRAEFPEFHHRCDFRVPQAVGSPAKFIDAA